MPTNKVSFHSTRRVSMFKDDCIPLHFVYRAPLREVIKSHIVYSE